MHPDVLKNYRVNFKLEGNHVIKVDDLIRQIVEKSTPKGLSVGCIDTGDRVIREFNMKNCQLYDAFFMLAIMCSGCFYEVDDQMRLHFARPEQIIAWKWDHSER